MANFYLDISAIGNEYQAYNDVPTTFGMPQDGNGKAGPGHTAAVAIATIDVAGCTGTSASIGVMGVSLTGLSATGAALATAIAAAINASATAVSATYSALLLPLNKLVYARVNPGLSTQVQIMLRIAGTDWVGFTPTQASISPAATISNFAGGANGPFAYFTNDTSVFGKAQFAYGIFTVKPSSVTEPGTNDVIITRTKRSDANLSYTVTRSSADLYLRTASSSARNFLFDNGVTWVGDNGQMLLTIINNAGGTNTYFGAGNAAKLTLEAAEKYGFKAVFKAASGTQSRIHTAGLFAYVTAIRCHFEAANQNVSTTGLFVGSGNDEQIVLIDCYCVMRRNQIFFNAGSGANHIYRGINSIFEWVGLGANLTQLLSVGAPTGGEISLTGSTFVVDGGAYTVGSLCAIGAIASSRQYLISVEDCIGIDNPSVGLPAFPPTWSIGPRFVWTDSRTYSFRTERTYVTTEFVSSATYPSLGLETPNGQPISYRISWESARLDNLSHIEVGRFGLFYKDTAGLKTCALEMLVPTTEIPTNAQFGMVLTYVDSTGVARSETTCVGQGAALSGSALPLPAGVGTGAWTLNGLSAVSSVKVALTTTYAVKQNSEMVATLFITGAPTGTRAIYVSPEIRVS